jgi:hypothetical protein
MIDGCIELLARRYPEQGGPTALGAGASPELADYKAQPGSVRKTR